MKNKVNNDVNGLLKEEIFISKKYLSSLCDRADIRYEYDASCISVRQVPSSVAFLTGV